MEDLIGGGFRLCVVGVGTAEFNLDEFPSCDVDCGQAAERVSVLSVKEVRSQGLYDVRRCGKLGQGDSLDIEAACLGERCSSFDKFVDCPILDGVTTEIAHN